MNDTLRDYQQEMKLRLFKEWELHRSVMVQMPTGTGKCRVTEAVFKICFAWAGKQLPAVFLNSKIQYGPLAQLGERQVRNLEVRGSIPLCSTK